MTMQWHLRAQNPAHRRFKLNLSFGRSTTFTTFSVLMVLLYVMIGADRRAIRSPNLVSQMIQPSEDETAGPNLPSTKSNPDFGVKSANISLPNKCDGRRIYIYEMSSEFNELLARNCQNLTAWMTMCEDLSNSAFGEQLQLPESDPMASILQPPDAWFRTNQFSLEVTIHKRLKIHPCLTTHFEEATMFYIPFYHTFDLFQNLENPDLSARDHLSNVFVEWLRAQPPWQRHHGNRHVLVLGRVVWDYIRSVSEDVTWGSRLLTFPELDNATKLLIERDPWEATTIGIPYPTSFHPSSETALLAWQSTVRASKRDQLVSVAGARRVKKLTGLIRDEVFDQCANSPLCKQVACTKMLCVERPQIIIQMGLESVFCLQPPGDSPTRKGIFDSLQSGCIPVLFNENQAAKQYLLHLPGNASAYSVIIPEDDVCNHHYDVMNHLSRIPQAEIAWMQENIVQLLPQLLYRNPVLSGKYTSKDAFDVAIDSLLDRFQTER